MEQKSSLKVLENTEQVRQKSCLTVSKARKILGLSGRELPDTRIQREIELAEFFAELIIKYYKEDEQSYNESRHA